MKNTPKYMLPALVAAFALAFVIATPYVMAESGYENHSWKDGQKHHKGHMIIHVDNFVGAIQISEDMDKESHKALKEQVTVSLSEASQGLDVMKGGIGIAVNEKGDKFVVWKLVSMDKNEDSETISATIHVVDAANAANKVTVTKEFDHSMKSQRHGDYGKMKGHFADLTDEQRAEKMAQFKEMKEAFEALSEDEQDALHSYFQGMKGDFADLTPEEKDAKKTEFKQQMEAFMSLSLDEKITYLKQLALSQQTQA